MNGRKSTSPTPSQHRHRKGRRLSQRGMLSVVMLLVSVVALGIAFLSGVKIVLDVLGDKPDLPLVIVLAQIIVIGLAYGIGWITAVLAIRVYGNLILPMLISWAAWGWLLAVCYLYIAIIKRMYYQPDDPGKFFKYLSVMASALIALVGLHLIVEDHDLRPFAIPLLIIALFQLGLIVFRYVFDAEGVKPGFLWKDLVFFITMITVSISMLAHWGVLQPFRTQLTNYFDRNSASIRTRD